MLAFALAPYAQKRKAPVAKARTTTVKKKQQPAQRTTKKAAAPVSIKGLQSQRQQIQRQIKEQEQRLR